MSGDKHLSWSAITGSQLDKKTRTFFKKIYFISGNQITSVSIIIVVKPK